MMRKLLQHIPLLLTTVTVLLSEALMTQKVCIGDSALLFQINDYNSCDFELQIKVMIEVNSTSNGNIAIWLHQDCTPKVDPKTNYTGYTGRLFLHENGSIMLHNVSNLDNKRYFVWSSKHEQSFDKREVVLNVTVPPSKDCKPIITQHGNDLEASLKPEDCGSPVATAYWKGYDNITNTNLTKLTISQGNRNRVHKACIKGDALECVKNKSQSENYCSVFPTNGNSTNGEHHYEKYFGNLTWEDIEEKLNYHQRQGLQLFCKQSEANNSLVVLYVILSFVVFTTILVIVVIWLIIRIIIGENIDERRKPNQDVPDETKTPLKSSKT